MIYSCRIDSMNVEIQKAVDICGIKKIAEVTGKSLQAIYAYQAGTRRVPPDACPAIERATGGQVTRKDLRPHDWRDIWPELEGE